jgi:LPPG:FO 2-phospho-L-lactate transferase
VFSGLNVRQIVALSGGVGGSRFTRGLRAAAPEAQLTAVINTGDDITLHGLRISPDVDTVLYALSGVVDDARGWGYRGDTFRGMAAFDRLGGETWFQLGDLDLATHLRRTELLASGWSPSEVTAELAHRLGIEGVTILPMTDQTVETWVQLAETQEWVHFQEYFVRRRTDVAIRAVRFQGIERALPAPGVIEALANAELIAICPSNPFVSIAPILGIAGMREGIREARARGAAVVGVSPLIGGATIKGPAARMLVELGHEASALGVARQYADVLDMFLIDPVDRQQAEGLRRLGIQPVIADARMRGRRGEARLARVVLNAVSGRRREAAA